MIDTHGHINFPDFDEDRDALIQRALDAGVSVIVNPGTTLETSRSAVALAQKYDCVYAAAGIHPHDVKDFSEGDLPTLKDLLSQNKVVALGEVGLDFYYEHSDRDEQMAWFETFVDLSIETAKPLIIHNRSSDAEMIACLKRKNLSDNPGVFHCFAAGLDMAKRALDLGFMISFSGIVTFKKAEELQEVARFVPLDRMVVETDCPYLAPVPQRGKRNEPAFTVHVAEKIAELKNITLEEVDAHTTANAKRLFSF